MSNGIRPSNPRFVALIPAAGVASRLPGLDSSKEMLRVDGEPVICHLLRTFRRAGVQETTIVLRQGKSDISDYLGEGNWRDLGIRFEMTPGTSGVPETVACGLPGFGEADVLFGFPDILFEPADAFVALGERLRARGADVVLGLFPTATPSKMDMVKVDSHGRVLDIEIKPAETSLDLTWIIAAWAPAFTRYLLTLMRHTPQRIQVQASQHSGQHLGHTLQLAMKDGLRVDSISFEEGRSLDIGTPDDLGRAQHWFEADGTC